MNISNFQDCAIKRANLIRCFIQIQFPSSNEVWLINFFVQWMSRNKRGLYDIFSLGSFPRSVRFQRTRVVSSSNDVKLYPCGNQMTSQCHSGHQMTGTSSVEAYIRSLLQGCRCVELDCIDGPNNEPIITHQNTFTTKIKLLDVSYTLF